MTTLSQVGLGLHLGKSAKWIRDQGGTVSWRGETWSRWRASTTERLIGYIKVATPDQEEAAEAMDNGRNTGGKSYHRPRRVTR